MTLSPEIIAAERRIWELDDELAHAHAHGTPEDVKRVQGEWKQARRNLWDALEEWKANRDKEED